MTEPQTPVEPTAAEIEETVETPTAESKTTVTSDLLDSDAFVEKVADRVFDKMKGFTTSLISAQEAAAEIAAEMVPIETAPPPNEAPPVEEAPPPDTGPQRRHKVFGQPFKRK